MSKKATRHRRPPDVLQGRVAECARRLQQIRLEKRMTQGEVAEVVGVTQAAVSRWEDPENTTIPSAAEIAELAEFFGVSADWLCGLSPYRSPLPVGQALVDLRLLEAFESAKTAKDLEKLVDHDLAFGAVWTSIPEGACVMDHDVVLRRVKAADKHVRRLNPRLWERWMRGVLGSV
ncbi:MAG TPA: helix-turn-helix transcriptional regulator [Planctomycetota bacterium]|nr:helix-turn-helix transcriptional regulator [Planctomycetota bacterium]